MADWLPLLAWLPAAPAICLLLLQRSTHNTMASLQEQADALAVRLADAERVAASAQALAETQALVGNVVNGGTRTTETVHQLVSGLTFDILDQIPATSRTSRIVREVHDETAKGVYGALKMLGGHLRGDSKPERAIINPKSQPDPGIEHDDENR